MSFRDEFDEYQKSSGTGGEFFKFKKDGDYKFRIMTEPVKKVSRYPYGICYEGAPYCQKDTIDKEWEELKKKAEAQGKDPSKVARPGVSVKWMVWAILREKDRDGNPDDQFVILDMAGKIATPLREMMDSEEYGFKEFPMPYDITIKVKNAGQTTVEYTVLAARANTPITDEEKAEFEKLTPIQQIKERLQAKKKEEYEGGKQPSGGIEYPTEDINPDDIPF